FQRNSLSSAALARAASARDRGGCSRWLQIFRLQFRLRSRFGRASNRLGVCTSLISKRYVWSQCSTSPPYFVDCLSPVFHQVSTHWPVRTPVGNGWYPPQLQLHAHCYTRFG